MTNINQKNGARVLFNPDVRPGYSAADAAALVNVFERIFATIGSYLPLRHSR